MPAAKLIPTATRRTSIQRLIDALCLFESMPVRQQPAQADTRDTL